VELPSSFCVGGRGRGEGEGSLLSASVAVGVWPRWWYFDDCD
jgi:hypothetical protein